MALSSSASPHPPQLLSSTVLQQLQLASACVLLAASLSVLVQLLRKPPPPLPPALWSGTRLHHLQLLLAYAAGLLPLAAAVVLSGRSAALWQLAAAVLNAAAFAAALLALAAYPERAHTRANGARAGVVPRAPLRLRLALMLPLGAWSTIPRGLQTGFVVCVFGGDYDIETCYRGLRVLLPLACIV